MTPGSGHSVLGLVELSDDHDGSEINAATSFRVLRDAFEDRLRGWVRPKDQWRTMKNNRVCVILKDINSSGEIELAAAKLKRIFAEPHYHLGRAMPLSVTAGFAEVDGDASDMTLAMRQASIALNRAKKTARAYEVYSPQSGLNPNAEKGLREKLHLALERGEFQLYFQPKVHAGYRSLIGAEALIRWHTSGKQVITPDQFIDVAERCEIIKPMTWWVIKSAVARLARWPDGLSIAVNISPNLLLDDDVIAVVRDALDIYGVAAERLNLEVTEQIMVENQDTMLLQLAGLHDLGVKISIDDFGTGFSSLAYFRDLPVDEIKIDRSFVMRMLKSEKDHAIVKAVIDLAHNFSLKVVAEGVESQEIADRLAEMRCDILQGYFFDRPLPVEEFEKNYRI